MMTKRREPLTYHSALTAVAARIGWDRCAAICGVTERAVRYWSDPDCETEIRLLDAERLDRAFMSAGGDHAPFQRLYALRLEVAARDAIAQDLTNLAGVTAKEAGEAVAALIDAASRSGCIETRRRARKEASEAIDVLTSGLAMLDRLETGEAA